jgi:hypothetical protein
MRLFPEISSLASQRQREKTFSHAECQEKKAFLIRISSDLASVHFNRGNVLECQGKVRADLVLDVALKGKSNRLSRFRRGCPYDGFPLQGAHARPVLAQCE